MERITHVPEANRQWSARFNRYAFQSLSFLKSITAIALFFLLWEIAPRMGMVDAVFMPPFSTVLASGFELALNGQLFSHISASFTRSIIGFLVGMIIAIPLGLVIGWFTTFSKWLTPLLELFRNTAALAVLPVFILLLGIGELSKVAVVIYACFFPILISTISAVRHVDPLYIKAGKSLALTPYRLFMKIILPASVPTIFVGLRLAAASSILVLVAAEMIGAKAGLGYLIISSQHTFQIPHMYVGILTISIIGLGVNALLVFIEKKNCCIGNDI